MSPELNPNGQQRSRRKELLRHREGAPIARVAEKEYLNRDVNSSAAAIPMEHNYQNGQEDA
ncbi:hypothetical protein OUZ56_024636 [Daphnia magna]|uniref:Uncharacterized protein n=1 Tax=Daphnia magna TaxID=35525 RepID=A0ABR0B1A5_9CRUS|nr:hypothetical protein OUZ56_024636 [Daphnia magna]